MKHATATACRIIWYGLVHIRSGSKYLLKGVGTFYNEDILVSKQGSDRIRIVFQEARTRRTEELLETES
jgi:hypothetical protein